jgi:hypothetical protein
MVHLRPSLSRLLHAGGWLCSMVGVPPSLPEGYLSSHARIVILGMRGGAVR